ncbi:MAG: hypothetical protein J6A01_11990 [Proteobacteria bacterium]|nr:hypothetical protein [Pseudomonadota bacterium]
MKHSFILALFLSLTALSYTGCSQISEQIQDIFAPTIDATSANTFIESMQKVRDELSPADKEKFDAAIAYFSIEYVKNNPGQTIAAGAVVALGGNNQLGNTITENLTKDFMMQFHGKTAKGIIREYEKANGK